MTWCAAEIEARAEMESDKKLEKLETFLGRLNSKGELIDAKSVDFYFLWARCRSESTNHNYIICCQNLWKMKLFSFAVMVTWKCFFRCCEIFHISFCCTVISISSSLLVSDLQETTLTVTEKAVKEVMRLDDEIFSKFYCHMTDIPRSMSSRMHLDEDFDAIFGKQTPT